MSEKPLRVAIVDANLARASIIEAGLRDAGVADVAIIDDISHALKHVVDADPDVIFIDLENPNRDELEYMFQVSRLVKRPVAMFVDRSDQDAIEAAIDAGVSAYIVDGLRQERVKPILDMAVSRFNAFDRLQRELETAKSELANRKTIDRAKRVLMSSRGLSEPDAYALLRKTAMNQNRRIADVAESLLLAADLLNKEDG
ncbi:MAG: ANTAR domain-containing protein [Pseudomonadota bacterium]